MFDVSRKVVETVYFNNKTRFQDSVNTYIQNRKSSKDLKNVMICLQVLSLLSYVLLCRLSCLYLNSSSKLIS